MNEGIEAVREYRHILNSKGEEKEGQWRTAQLIAKSKKSYLGFAFLGWGK